jgi:GMP synthase-like glutamine amidotransferase/LmbE family N-acetylglucosaminyl deacetylase
VDFGSAGTVAAFTSAGIEVTYCVVTNGDAGGSDRSMSRSDMASLRQDEQRAAAALVGVTDVRFLGHPDGMVQATPELRRDISRVIRQVKPGRVITQSPERNWEFIFASHPDHMAAGEAAVCAVYPDARNPFAHTELLDVERLEPWTVGELWIMGPGDGRPAVAVDTTATVERKVAADVPQEPDLRPRRRVRARALRRADRRRVGGTAPGRLRRDVPRHPHPLTVAGDTAGTWVVLQHVAHEGPGAIAPAIRMSGGDMRVVRIDLGEHVPTPEEASDMAGLVVMGGPMGVHDPLPWLIEERALLGAAVEASLPVLGVCLGAQQLAAALGGEVFTGPQPECGVGEVHLTNEALHDPVFGPAPTPLPCVHWHGDTFGLPSGAVRLAGNEAYENQAFRVGDRAYGLQFHVEVTGSLVAHWAHHLPAGVFIRTSDVAHVSREGEGIVRRFAALGAPGRAA